MTARIAFMPWLRLQEPQHFGRVEFLPFRSDDGTVTAQCADVAPFFERILSSYSTLDKKPVHNCTVVILSGGWNVGLSDEPAIQTARSALFLSALSANS